MGKPVTDARNANQRPSVSYLRCSTDKQDQSIEDQRREITRWAQQHGHLLIDEYVDDATSGTTTVGRKAFRRLMADSQAPGCAFQYVLVYDVSRFGRVDSDEAGYHRHLLRKSGVEVVYVAEGFTGTESDDLLRSFKQHNARQESIKTSRDTLRGQVTNARGGWWSGGTPPYGFDLDYVDRNGEVVGRIRYLETGERQLLDSGGSPVRILAKRERYRKSDGDKVRLVPGESQRVDIVQQIFGLYDSGLGYTAIADRLNQANIPSPRNGNYSSKVKPGWAGSTIKGILENHAYVGDVVWNRRTSAKFHRVSEGRSVPRPSGAFSRLQRNEKSDFVVKENAHPPLVERDLFERVHAKKKSRRDNCGHGHRTGRAAKSQYLLSGLIECSDCGRNFSGQPQNRGRRRKDGSRVVTR